MVGGGRREAGERRGTRVTQRNGISKEGTGGSFSDKAHNATGRPVGFMRASKPSRYARARLHAAHVHNAEKWKILTACHGQMHGLMGALLNQAGLQPLLNAILNFPILLAPALSSL